MAFRPDTGPRQKGRVPFSSQGFIAPQVIQPRPHLCLASGKRTQSAGILLEGILDGTCRADDRAIAFHHEFDAVSGPETRTRPGLLRNGDRVGDTCQGSLSQDIRS